MSESDQSTKVQPECSRPQVLIIDDAPEIHRLVAMRLRTEGLDFVSAYDGSEGVRQATSEVSQPSLILLDLDMPGMHGLCVLQALKADPKTIDIPVIVVSGQQLPNEKVKAFEYGAVDYITKPFEMTELRVRVRQALKMRQLIQMLAQRAQIDGMTGLWNRSFFNQRWGEEFARATRYSHPLSLAMADVDHFKSVNDTYGHAAGDAVLQGVAKVLMRECRQHDLVCRYGGEEFVIVMPETAPGDAAGVCDRIREALASEVWQRHPERQITASIGVAGSNGATNMNAQQWVETADANLYAAKRGGRNRVQWSDLSVQAARPVQTAA